MEGRGRRGEEGEVKEGGEGGELLCTREGVRDEGEVVMKGEKG